MNSLKSLAQWFYHYRNSNLPPVAFNGKFLPLTCATKRNKKIGKEKRSRRTLLRFISPYCPLPQSYPSTDTPTALPDGDPPAGSRAAIPAHPFPNCPLNPCNLWSSATAGRHPWIIGGAFWAAGTVRSVQVKSSDLSCYEMLISLVILGNMLYIVCWVGIGRQSDLICRTKRQTLSFLG